MVYTSCLLSRRQFVVNIVTIDDGELDFIFIEISGELMVQHLERRHVSLVFQFGEMCLAQAGGHYEKQPSTEKPFESWSCFNTD